jgi:hypothetical protein
MLCYPVDIVSVLPLFHEISFGCFQTCEGHFCCILLMLSIICYHFPPACNVLYKGENVPVRLLPAAGSQRPDHVAGDEQVRRGRLPEFQR